MSKAMKGLLKGLRYISEIFEADNEKEPEIQIGAPTDVKHVAHIGCDGPSSNAPSWMNEFQGSDAGSSDVNGGKDGTSNRHGKSKQSKKQASNKSTNSDIETSRGRRAKTSTAGSESPSQEAGAKKNRRKKRSNKDPSASNDD
ncbi:putative CRIB domain-containing protein [Helianthus annuus]|uniref:CRIB domain-containing protein n=1 Tax=Helianthus annuus TaxID=4232 RepID=A0A251VQL2_HELAN|nr:putative CRIB domain-containing protein [Helianthus annuus]KAJ0624016.1 putative CRIB domain-containing protein [Helianthus annuus]KAJ0627875.1 putative CRIB domain-containing protein RIC1 [Helianthus annuus]KAJ0784152.1 putative CRIB domain-containing protein RIC1 [Helianthus annuus]KAJ0793354.1 putative CRIB domain-containing protein RIC1 [Helianthus annuus]